MNSHVVSYDKVKIVVVGDSGVGKTSLIHLLRYNKPIANPSWTIGCSVEVKLHAYRAGTPSEQPYYVELWDIGGHAAHANSRGIFFSSVQGIILVHDLSNRKSEQNLRRWMTEVLSKGNKDAKESSSNSNYELDSESFVGSTDVPILVVGTKLDLVEEINDTTSNRRSLSVAEELSADEIRMDTNSTKHISPGSGNAVKLSRFFDRVIQRKFFAREKPFQSPFQTYSLDRRRITGNPLGYTLASKSSHQD